MQSSPPASDGKARAIRELSRSLSHSPRNIDPPSPRQSDSNPTQRSGFGGTHSSSQFWNDPDIHHSTQHNIADDTNTNTLPQYPRIRSTAKKLNTWAPFRSEQIQPDTSMINKEFLDFDHSISDEESMAVEQARGGNRSNRGTPSRISSKFDSLYDVTPPTNRSRKSHLADTGSLRRDAAIRRASRNDLDAASPRPSSKRKSPALAKEDRKRNTLAQLHAKLSEDESSFMDQRPPTVTIDSTKNSRWSNRSRQASLQIDGNVDTVHSKGTPRSKQSAAQNATAQSFILPDLPNLTELVSGVFDDGTPVFSKTTTSRSRFSAPPNGGRRPTYVPVEGVPIPDEEKAIFSALQQLQEKVAEMEHERAEQEKKIEEQDLELIELRAAAQAQEKFRRSDSAQDSDTSAKNSWKIEKTRKFLRNPRFEFILINFLGLDATVQTLRTRIDRADRKVAVLEIEKKRLNTEKESMANQLGIAFQTCEELKDEKRVLSNENEELRKEVEILRAENEALRDRLDQDQSQHLEETTQLRRQFDQAANATEKENANLHAELARVRAEHDENTQQLSRRDAELRRVRQEQAEYASLKADHESLRSQLAELKARREEDAQRWARLEASLRSKVDRRDETIRHFQDTTQEQTNEAIRLDNENLRNELLELQAQQDEEYEQWARKEAELQRKIQLREKALRKSRDDFDDATTSRSASRPRAFEEPLQRRPSYRREDTRTRIKNRVQQEVRNSKFESQESPRKSFTNHSRFSTRSASAPVSTEKHARVESEVESTTDLSLAPRSTLRISRNTVSARQTTIQPPDLDLTELSYIDKDQIAQIRRLLEEDRVAGRERASSAPAEEVPREDTVRSQRQTREDTIRSVASAKSERRPSLVRKSSLKDTTQRTNGTQFEEDTGNLSNADVDAEATQTKQSIDASMASNTSRRRRSAPTEMTSAFIVPDIKLSTSKKANAANIQRALPKEHDNNNCTFCRREGYTTTTEALRVPRLVPASVRTADDVDATLRPAQSPKEALALVVKGLNDERIHLHAELAIQRALLEQHDPSLGNRKRVALNESIQDLLRRIDFLDKQVYRLFDVLEGQQADDLTEQDVEELTGQIRVEEEKTGHSEKKAKKVTIRSFVDEDDSVEIGRGGINKNDGADEEEDNTQELPWEGFEDEEDSGPEGDHSYSAMVF